MKYVNIIAVSLLTGAWSAPTPPRSLDLATRNGDTLADGNVKRLSKEGRQSARPLLGLFNGWITHPAPSGGKRRDVNLGYKEARQFLGGLLGSDDEGAGAVKREREANGDAVSAHNDKRQVPRGVGDLLDTPLLGAKREANGHAGPAHKGKRQPPPPPPPPPPQPTPSDSTRRDVKTYKEGRQLLGSLLGSDDEGAGTLKREANGHAGPADKGKRQRPPPPPPPPPPSSSE
ncbi:hypothetical protein C8A01DRAFT_37643 [Parachaetomium inaequale]|uniref:Uncharacterized protein n=1 Tax=Parachaetomium inaequale TaxID=2588326 RepID=A0AAN6PEE9_9PEZI|nr:hypothetical protein C8A01DRAFT_37643 [Parachaetomium inaequale]